jgi:hypothetical protein
MNIVKKYIPSIVHVVGVLVIFLTPSVNQFASAHATYSATVLLVWGVALHHFQSPLAR